MSNNAADSSRGSQLEQPDAKWVRRIISVSMPGPKWSAMSEEEKQRCVDLGMAVVEKIQSGSRIEEASDRNFDAVKAIAGSLPDAVKEGIGDQMVFKIAGAVAQATQDLLALHKQQEEIQRGQEQQ